MQHACLAALDSIQTDQEVRHALAVGQEPILTSRRPQLALNAVLGIFPTFQMPQPIPRVCSAMLDTIQVQKKEAHIVWPVA